MKRTFTDTTTPIKYDDIVNQKMKSPIDYAQIDWKSYLAKANDYIKNVKKVLEDDSDVKELEKYKNDLDDLENEAAETTDNFDNTEDVWRSSKTRKKSKGNDASQNSKEEYAEELHGHQVKIYRKMQELREAFPLHAGGFGAKGRAHEMDVHIGQAVGAPGTGYKMDPSYIEDITLDGARLDGSTYVFKKNMTVAETAGRRVVNGKNVAGTESETWKRDQIDAIERNVEDLRLPNKVRFSGTPVAQDRGKGQFANMADTNATGYAWLANVPGWSKTRWEWLHVRAASMGGKTDGSNLVAGTRDCNTHMIPFESNIKVLSAIANEEPEYDKVDVDFSVGGQDLKAPHKVDEIEIDWKLRKAGDAPQGTKEPRGTAVFKPLNTSSNISKSEVGYLEKTLQDIRDGIA